MINIQRGMTNSCVFTLTENVTIVSPNFILEVYSNQDHNTKLMWLNDDVSPDLIRYNQYEIVETSTEDLTDQRISLDSGTYDYRVWQTGLTALSLTMSTSVVESGKITVTGTVSTPSVYESGQDEYTFE